jgi:hypothetical protein
MMAHTLAIPAVSVVINRKIGVQASLGKKCKTLFKK